MCEARAEFVAPAADRLVTDNDTALEQQFFNITQAKLEPEIPPNRETNDCRRQPVAVIKRFSFLHRDILRDYLANVTVPAKEAKLEKATIYWGDEMGLRSDHISGTSFALKGQTPVVRATGQGFGCNMVSAITNRGELSFMVFEGTFRNATVIEFMKRMLRQVTRKIYLIVDGHPVHRSVAVRQFVADNAERLRLIRLPGYCPELNPDELLNQDVKSNALGKSRPTSKAEMIGTVRRHLHRRQKEPHVIRNLFKEKHVRYAALIKCALFDTPVR
ncbi:transposase [Paraburkholderia sp. JPY465]